MCPAPSPSDAGVPVQEGPVCGYIVLLTFMLNVEALLFPVQLTFKITLRANGCRTKRHVDIR